MRVVYRTMLERQTPHDHPLTLYDKTSCYESRFTLSAMPHTHTLWQSLFHGFETLC